MGDLFSLISGGIGVIFTILVFLLIIFIARYKRCPSNRILVIYGRVGKGRSAKCLHGGGAFVIPLVQASKFMSLQPLTIEINLQGALSKQNIRINTPSTFTVGISTLPDIMLNAAERLLGLDEKQITSQAEDIILGQLRLVIATLNIEEINQDRELFLKQINENVASELNKIGLQLINVNIKDITDESGYIEAIGQKSAAEAINQAKVEVAEQDRNGAIGSAKANREKEVEVAKEAAETKKGQKEAEQMERIAVAKYEATAVQGENTSNASVAEYNADLEEKKAAALRRSDIAKANASQAILEAERETETARLEKEEVVRQQIDLRKIEIEADAQAEKSRRVAKGDADATVSRYEAEAQGLKKLLQAKAEGYQQIIKGCNNDPKMAATLLLIEKMEELVAKQVEAISNLKIDKITVWDSGGGNGEGSSTSNFLKSFIGSLPPLQDLARQAGVELPGFLGTVTEKEPPKAK